MARDQGSVPYMDFGTVDVKILDMNDNTPVFKTVSKLLLHTFLVRNYFDLSYSIRNIITHNVSKTLFSMSKFLDFWSVRGERKRTCQYNHWKSFC